MNHQPLELDNGFASVRAKGTCLTVSVIYFSDVELRRGWAKLHGGQLDGGRRRYELTIEKWRRGRYWLRLSAGHPTCHLNLCVVKLGGNRGTIAAHLNRCTTIEIVFESLGDEDPKKMAERHGRGVGVIAEGTRPISLRRLRLFGKWFNVGLPSPKL